MIAFIADLHLQDSTPDTIAQAVGFTDWAKGRCERLYILGDLFEYWLGDDHPLPGLEGFNTGLKNLSESGCSITVMHGNRDFLLGEGYCHHIGARLERADTLAVQLGEHSALLLHGDTLCTDDTDYQQARLLLRNPRWQKEFSSLSFEVRKEHAQALRRQSKDSSTHKTEDIMDVNSAAAETLATAQNADLLIHGHTHRPFVHEMQNHRRVVLGDWHPTGGYIALYDKGEVSLQHWKNR